MKIDTTNIIDQAGAKQPINVQPSELEQSPNELNKQQIAFNNITTDKSQADESSESEGKSDVVNMEEVAQKLQDFVDSLNTSLRFSVDKESGRDIIKVVDSESGDLIRQFPSEEVLDVIKSLSKATGTLFSEKV